MRTLDQAPVTCQLIIRASRSRVRWLTDSIVECDAEAENECTLFCIVRTQVGHPSKDGWGSGKRKVRCEPCKSESVTMKRRDAAESTETYKRSTWHP